MILRRAVTASICVLAIGGCRAEPRGAQGAKTEAGAEGLRYPGWAWWMTLRVVPADSTIGGVPVTAIDSSWALASPLRIALLPAGAVADTTDSANRARPQDFAVGGDFNRDGIPD